MPPLDYGSETNGCLREAFELYAKARRHLIVGEGLIAEIVLPCVNEIRNGWDDLWQVLNGRCAPGSQAATDFLLDAARHFRRASAEVFEAVLIVRLDELCSILQSLRKDPSYRIVKSRYYKALQSAFDRGRVELANAKDCKHQTPDAATQSAKTGIAVVQNAIDAFMQKVGEFDLADEVRRIRQGQAVDRILQRRWLVLQIAIAVVLFVLCLVAGKLKLLDRWWPDGTTRHSLTMPASESAPTDQP